MLFRYSFRWVVILVLLQINQGYGNASIFNSRQSKVRFKGPRGPSAFYFLPDNGYTSEAAGLENTIKKATLENYKRNSIPTEVETEDIEDAMKDRNDRIKLLQRRIALLRKQKRDKSKLNRYPQERIVAIDVPTTRQSIYKRYVQKHLKHPVKVFKRVINVLKKRSGHALNVPANYYLLPTGPLKRSSAKLTKSLHNGKRHTQIDTHKFHLSILEKQPPHLRRRLEENASRRSDLSFGKLNNDRKKTIENQILSLVLNKLHKSSASERRQKLQSPRRVSLLDEIEQKENESEEIINAIHRRQEKKRRLTNLFVRFMEDLTEKLNLDPLAIADMMVRRAISKRSKVFRRW